jgi:hypothetical protein
MRLKEESKVSPAIKSPGPGILPAEFYKNLKENKHQYSSNDFTNLKGKEHFQT